MTLGWSVLIVGLLGLMIYSRGFRVVVACVLSGLIVVVAARLAYMAMPSMPPDAPKWIVWGIVGLIVLGKISDWWERRKRRGVPS
jgi:hypothetical protein